MVQLNFMILLIISAYSFYTDLRWGKILNIVTFPGMFIGIVMNTVFYGYDGLLFSLKGLVVGFIALFALFLLGGVGAGDVKLFGAIGALMGYSFVLELIMYSVFFGAAIGVLILVVENRFFVRMLESLRGLFIGVSARKLSMVKNINKSGKRFPFMYAVFPATLTLSALSLL